MDDRKALAEAIEVARATVDATPADPPTWQHARAIATYANTLLVEDDFAAAREWAERGLAAARAAERPWVQADALVTLGFISNREGHNDEAIELLTGAHKQAREAKVLGVELRAAYHLARAHLERGDLAIGAAVAHEGTKRANQTGLDMAPFGLDVQHLHFQCHFADGKWDHAQEIADGFPVRVTSIAEAYLSSMALFIDVARGNPAVAERRAWIEPFWSAHGFDEFTARGLLAEHALWQGDTEQAVAEAADRDRRQHRCAMGLLAVGDQAGRGRPERASRPGGAGPCRRRRREPPTPSWPRQASCCRSPARARRSPGGPSSSSAPRDAAGWPGPRRSTAAPAAITTRRRGRPSWTSSGPAYVYETARTRWRLAEALAEAGRRDEAADQWRLAAQTADKLKARPLRAALDDLARRARIGTAEQHGDGAVLASLTSREREVLRLIAAGRSNREIASVLFIAPKTASVHVSNILAKLGAASRTEAAAIAHREGLTSQPSGR